MNAVLLDLLVVVAVAVAAVGIVVPVLPGTLLALAAFLVWAVITGGMTAWVTLGVIILILGLGEVLKYLLPRNSLTAAGVPGRSILVGGIAAIIGFFLIPIVGLVVGFIGGLYVAEHVRLRDWPQARESTWVAMKATGFSILIELGALLLAATVWGGALVLLAQG
ncbi:MAG TPA: DUF456 domain-containing protein [Motilibacterales bacterium]|nr:DUF456 domain-containing protein [Motilibacterales bacterium]